MRSFIDPPTVVESPTVGEVLLEEFIVPKNISEDKLAIDLEILVSQIQDIVNDIERISPEISSCLGKYFGVSEKYFLNLQKDIDRRK